MIDSNSFAFPEASNDEVLITVKLGQLVTEMDFRVVQLVGPLKQFKGIVLNFARLSTVTDSIAPYINVYSKQPEPTTLSLDKFRRANLLIVESIKALEKAA